jgi:signal transduction histidine kinase
VENGVKFTDQGTVEVSASGQIEARKLALSLKVRDTGIGIAPEKLPLVFETFRQLDSGLARGHNGLGLGLSLVEKLTALMGGSLAVDSTPGRGSTFSVTVPLALPDGERATPGD